jgi:hypothetical protein
MDRASQRSLHDDRRQAGYRPTAQSPASGASGQARLRPSGTLARCPRAMGTRQDAWHAFAGLLTLERHLI